MFKFVKELNEHAYQNIITGVEKDFDSPFFLNDIAIVLEEILKPFCKGLLKSKEITLGKIINEQSARVFLKMQVKLTDKEILDIKKINKIYTDVKHESITPSKDQYLYYYRLLFDICCKVYTFNFGHKPDCEWNNDYIKNITKNSANIEEENKLLREEKEKLQEFQVQNLEEIKTLKSEIEKYSKQIVKVELQSYNETESSDFKFSPSLKPKDLTTKQETIKKYEIKNNLVLASVGENYQISISDEQNLTIIYDFIKRGWFEQSFNEIKNLNNSNGETLYLKLLSNYHHTSLNEFSNKSIVAEINEIEKIIDSSTQSTAQKLLDILIAKFDKSNFNDKSKIFNLIKKYKFTSRTQLIENYGEEIKAKLNNKIEIDFACIIDYLSSIEKDYNKVLSEFIDITINNKLFTLSNSLVNLILNKDDKNIYALSKKLLIDCQATNEDELTQKLENIDDFDVFSLFFNELSQKNNKLFLNYAEIVKNFIASKTALNHIDTAFKLFEILYQYSYPDREELKLIMKNQLLISLTNQNNNVFDYLETILSWATNKEEYLALCEEFSIKSLESDINDDRFIALLNKIEPNNFTAKKIKMFYKLNLSFLAIKPLINTGLFDNNEFETLIQLSKEEEQNTLVHELLSSLTLAIENTRKFNENIDKNYSLFNYLLSYYNKESASLYETIKIYVLNLLKYRYFDIAFDSLSQMMSLNVNNHEVCFLMLLAKYKASSEKELYDSDVSIIENEFYKLALKTAFIENKDDYNHYLDIYSIQQEKINERKQKEKDKKKIEKDRLFNEKLLLQKKSEKKQKIILKCLYSSFLICLLAFVISLAAFFRITGLTIFIGFFSILILALIIVLNNSKDINYTHKKIIICSILLPITIGATIGSLYGIHATTETIEYEYSYDKLKIKIGCNHSSISNLIVPSRNGLIDIKTVQINCSRNNYINSIKIPYGIEKLGSSDFSDCKNLNSIYIPSTVNSIVYNAFSGAGHYVIYYGGSQTEWKQAYSHSTSFGTLRVKFNSYC